MNRRWLGPDEGLRLAASLECEACVLPSPRVPLLLEFVSHPSCRRGSPEFRLIIPPRSEYQLQSELDLPRRGGGGRDRSRGRTVAASGECDDARRPEIRTIQNVEKLRPELQIHTLFDRNIFEQRGIYREQPWAAQ